MTNQAKLTYKLTTHTTGTNFATYARLHLRGTRVDGPDCPFRAEGNAKRAVIDLAIKKGVITEAEAEQMWDENGL